VGKGTRLLGEGEDELAADLVVLEGKGTELDDRPLSCT
jgi:hypothetical protein